MFSRVSSRAKDFRRARQQSPEMRQAAHSLWEDGPPGFACRNHNSIFAFRTAAIDARRPHGAKSMLSSALPQASNRGMNSKAHFSPGQSDFLKPFWTRIAGPPWLVSLLALAILAGLRFTAVFGPPAFEVLFFLQFVLTWALPFILLTPGGRRQIGLREHGLTPASLAFSALAGACCALGVFALGMVLYGNFPNNWCVSLRDYLRVIDMRFVLHPAVLYALYAVPALIFTPIADELLFRGIMQQAFTIRWNAPLATLVNCLSYGFMYLYFHAIWQDAAGLHIRVVSGALTVLLLAAVGLVFTLCRVRSGSLWPAMAAHAAFNLALLGAGIFYSPS